MSTERLDAIVIGASVEGLFAAAALARAGRYVSIYEARAEPTGSSDGRDALVSLAAVNELDLVSHGLRLGGAPGVVGVAEDHALVIWPDILATQSSIAALSVRDADAYEGFCVRMGRAASAQRNSPDHAHSNWLLNPGAAAEISAAQAFMRTSSLARILDEEFTSGLLKGMLAQRALGGTGASQQTPGSASLLLRQSMLSLYGQENSCRYVAGGEAQLKRSLLAALKFYNTVDIHQGQGVKEVVLEKDAVHAILLRDGSSARAPVVISSLGGPATEDLLGGGVRQLSARPNERPAALIRFTTTALPNVRGVGPALVASGATLQLNPGLDRLARSHAAFRARHLMQDYCLDMKVRPAPRPDQAMRFDVHVSVLYVPSDTDEGPWSGNRRERFVAACAKAIEVWAPGFESSIETSLLLHPAEAETFVDTKGHVSLARQAKADSTAVPEANAIQVGKPLKGLLTIESNLFTGQGSGGMQASKASGLSKRAKAPGDA